MLKKMILMLLFSIGFLSMSAAWADYSGGLGAVADNIRGPFEVARYFFNAGSYVLGIGFLIGGFFRFLKFRYNPQEAPLSSVIVLFLVGVTFILIPLTYQLSHYLAITGGMYDLLSS
jgi:hypothetical protein